MLVASVLLAAVAVPLAGCPGPAGAAALGSVAGLAFGSHRGRLPDAARRPLPGDILGELDTLLTSPTTYALVLAGVVAMLTYSIALQRGSVTQATAPLVVGETVAPALVGLLLLGDHARPAGAGSRPSASSSRSPGR